MKILLDTNILIASFITHGMCSDLLDHCIHYHKLITSEFVLNEFRENLIRKFKYTKEDIEQAIDLLLLKMEIVTPVMLENQVCRDPDDDMVLGTAISGSVECVITGDKDLLSIKQFNSIDIISPSEFYEYEITKRV
jgi:putative PIN family toxin of toxin-antitoxin system